MGKNRKGKDKNALFYQIIDTFERTVLIKHLTECAWNRKATARELGISYRTLLNKLEVHGITKKIKELDAQVRVAAASLGN